MTDLLRRLVKWFYLLIAMMLILLAILVQSGRSFSYLLSDYNVQIESYLSQRLGAMVSIDSLKADWKGLRPGVKLQGINIVNDQGEPIANIDRAMLRLDILRSLKNASLVWNDLTIEKIQLSFKQMENGFWSLQGLTNLNRESSEKSKIDPLIDMLLLSHHLSIKKSHLRFYFKNGQELLLTAPKLYLENKRDFHRLVVQVDIENKPKSLFFLLEANGDPRDQKDFQAKAYLELNNFATGEPLQAATSFLLSGQDSYLNSEGELTTKIWAETREDNSGIDLKGRLDLERLIVNVNDRNLGLDKFSTDLNGYWLRDGKWSLGLQSISADLKNEKIKDINLIASSSGFQQSVHLRVDKLDLEQVHLLIEHSRFIRNEKLWTSLQTLQPKGLLSRLQISFPYQNPKDWVLATHVQGVCIQPWLGAPGLTGVDGYLQATKKGGFISIRSLNGFSMFYPNIYSEPMVYDKLIGQVAWDLQRENNKIYVNSGELNFYQGKEQTKGFMWLSLPWIKGSDDTDLVLYIGSKELSPSSYVKYTPKTLSPTLLKWLETSVGQNNSGQVSNIGFIYRATLNKRDPISRVYQLDMDISNTNLKYHADWPVLTSISGHLLIDNATVIADVVSAKIYETQVNHASIVMKPKNSGMGSLLFIKGDLKGSAGDGLSVLREGALRRYIGNSMDSWFMFGDIETALKLTIPIGTQFPERDASQQVDIKIKVSDFDIKNLNLNITRLQGDIRYNNKSGLSSSKLTAYLFDKEVTGRLKTNNENNQKKTRIELEGTVATENLADWTRRPEARFFSGVLPYKLLVDLKHNNKTSDESVVVDGVYQSSAEFINDAFAEIKLTSNLSGVTVNLPEPYGKKAAAKKHFGFNMWLQPHYIQIQASYDSRVDSIFRMRRGEDSALLNANIALSQEAKFESDNGKHEPEFLLSGFLPSLDITPWKKIQLQYDEYSKQFNNVNLADQPNAALVAGLPFRSELILGQFTVGSTTFENLEVNAVRKLDGWNLDLKNSSILGTVFIPYQLYDPLNIQLKYLYLNLKNAPVTQLQSGQQTENEGPERIPASAVRIDQLYVNGELWGNINLQIRKLESGVIFDNIKGNIRGLNVLGYDDKTDGAQLIWQYLGNKSHSHFIGQLTTKNMADVLHNWNKPEMVESQSAKILVDVNWSSAPQHFHLADIQGLIELRLKDGRFHREASAGDGLLRLMSILNFDSLARRLRLDFSDLYKTGLAYDEISGKVKFDHGIMSFSDPLVVESPSSDLQMAGSLNLREETVNTRIVANLPVAGNLTLYTALATGLPAAAGVYIVSKLFKKQVSQFASVSYTMKGSWEKPKVKFDRLFESENSLRQSTKDTSEAPDIPSVSTEKLNSKSDLNSQP